MKKLYQNPEISMSAIASADIITASPAFLGDDGVIELAMYGFGGDFGGFNE